MKQGPKWHSAQDELQRGGNCSSQQTCPRPPFPLRRTQAAGILQRNWLASSALRPVLPPQASHTLTAKACSVRCFCFIKIINKPIKTMHKEQIIKDLLSTELMTYRINMEMAEQFNEENMHVVCINIPLNHDCGGSFEILILQISRRGEKSKHFCNAKNK